MKKLSTMIGKMIMSQDILKDLDILIIEDETINYSSLIIMQF